MPKTPENSDNFGALDAAALAEGLGCAEDLEIIENRKEAAKDCIVKSIRSVLRDQLTEEALMEEGSTNHSSLWNEFQQFRNMVAGDDSVSGDQLILYATMDVVEEVVADLTMDFNPKANQRPISALGIMNCLGAYSYFMGQGTLSEAQKRLGTDPGTLISSQLTMATRFATGTAFFATKMPQQFQEEITPVRTAFSGMDFEEIPLLEWQNALMSQFDESSELGPISFLWIPYDRASDSLKSRILQTFDHWIMLANMECHSEMIVSVAHRLGTATDSNEFPQIGEMVNPRPFLSAWCEKNKEALKDPEHIVPHALFRAMYGQIPGYIESYLPPNFVRTQTQSMLESAPGGGVSQAVDTTVEKLDVVTDMQVRHMADTLGVPYPVHEKERAAVGVVLTELRGLITSEEEQTVKQALDAMDQGGDPLKTMGITYAALYLTKRDKIKEVIDTFEDEGRHVSSILMYLTDQQILDIGGPILNDLLEHFVRSDLKHRFEVLSQASVAERYEEENLDSKPEIIQAMKRRYIHGMCNHITAVRMYDDLDPSFTIRDCMREKDLDQMEQFEVFNVWDDLAHQWRPEYILFTINFVDFLEARAKQMGIPNPYPKTPQIVELEQKTLDQVVCGLPALSIARQRSNGSCGELGDFLAVPANDTVWIAYIRSRAEQLKDRQLGTRLAAIWKSTNGMSARMKKSLRGTDQEYMIAAAEPTRMPALPIGSNLAELAAADGVDTSQSVEQFMRETLGMVPRSGSEASSFLGMTVGDLLAGGAANTADSTRSALHQALTSGLKTPSMPSKKPKGEKFDLTKMNMQLTPIPDSPIRVDVKKLEQELGIGRGTREQIGSGFVVIEERVVKQPKKTRNLTTSIMRSVYDGFTINWAKADVAKLRQICTNRKLNPWRENGREHALNLAFIHQAAARGVWSSAPNKEQVASVTLEALMVDGMCLFIDAIAAAPDAAAIREIILTEYPCLPDIIGRYPALEKVAKEICKAKGFDLQNEKFGGEDWNRPETLPVEKLFLCSFDEDTPMPVLVRAMDQLLYRSAKKNPTLKVAVDEKMEELWMAYFKARSPLVADPDSQFNRVFQKYIDELGTKTLPPNLAALIEDIQVHPENYEQYVVELEAEPEPLEPEPERKPAPAKEKPKAPEVKIPTPQILSTDLNLQESTLTVIYEPVVGPGVTSVAAAWSVTTIPEGEDSGMVDTECIETDGTITFPLPPSYTPGTSLQLTVRWSLEKGEPVGIPTESFEMPVPAPGISNEASLCEAMLAAQTTPVELAEEIPPGYELYWMAQGLNKSGNPRSAEVCSWALYEGEIDTSSIQLSSKVRGVRACFVFVREGEQPENLEDSRIVNVDAMEAKNGNGEKEQCPAPAFTLDPSDGVIDEGNVLAVQLGNFQPGLNIGVRPQGESISHHKSKELVENNGAFEIKDITPGTYTYEIRYTGSGKKEGEWIPFTITCNAVEKAPAKPDAPTETVTPEPEPAEETPFTVPTSLKGTEQEQWESLFEMWRDEIVEESRYRGTYVEIVIPDVLAEEDDFFIHPQMRTIRVENLTLSDQKGANVVQPRCFDPFKNKVLIPMAREVAERDLDASIEQLITQLPKTYTTDPFDPTYDESQYKNDTTGDWHIWTGKVWYGEFKNVIENDAENLPDGVSVIASKESGKSRVLRVDFDVPIGGARIRISAHFTGLKTIEWTIGESELDGSLEAIDRSREQADTVSSSSNPIDVDGGVYPGAIRAELESEMADKFKPLQAYLMQMLCGMAPEVERRERINEEEREALRRFNPLNGDKTSENLAINAHKRADEGGLMVLKPIPGQIGKYDIVTDYGYNDLTNIPEAERKDWKVVITRRQVPVGKGRKKIEHSEYEKLNTIPEYKEVIAEVCLSVCHMSGARSALTGTSKQITGAREALWGAFDTKVKPSIEGNTSLLGHVRTQWTDDSVEPACSESLPAGDAELTACIFKTMNHPDYADDPAPKLERKALARLRTIFLDTSEGKAMADRDGDFVNEVIRQWRYDKEVGITCQWDINQPVHQFLEQKEAIWRCIENGTKPKK